MYTLDKFLWRNNYFAVMDARVYCNATYLKSLYDDASSTCHNETDYLATSCDISWRKNNITKTCENGEWKTTSASLDEVEVQLCDDPTVSDGRRFIFWWFACFQSHKVTNIWIKKMFVKFMKKTKVLITRKVSLGKI